MPEPPVEAIGAPSLSRGRGHLRVVAQEIRQPGWTWPTTSTRLDTMTTTPTLTYRRHLDRYYVHLDGQQVGWVLKSSDGTWAFYATVRTALEGEPMATGYATRRMAVCEGLGTLRIYHLGRVVTLDEPICFDEATLRAAAEALFDADLDAKYGKVEVAK